LLKLSRLQTKTGPYGIQQFARPRIPVRPLPCFRTLNGLHSRNTCLTTLAALHKALEHIDAMEKASLISSTSSHHRCLYGRIDIQFDLRLAVERYRGTTEQGKVQLARFVEHPLGFVPTGGEVLVIEDRHGALALLENPDNLLIQPPTWIVFLPFEIGVII